MQYLSRRCAISLGFVAAASLLLTRAPSVAADKVPLAIKGYDPVAYFTAGQPMHGRPELEYEWDELRYLFSTVEHLNLFKADPVRYAPQFGNYCAMALAKGEISHQTDVGQ